LHVSARYINPISNRFTIKLIRIRKAAGRDVSMLPDVLSLPARKRPWLCHFSPAISTSSCHCHTFSLGSNFSKLIELNFNFSSVEIAKCGWHFPCFRTVETLIYHKNFVLAKGKRRLFWINV
jgi:hypothetical protein